MTLKDGAGNVVSQTTTDPNGNYTFAGIVVDGSTYTVAITNPVGTAMNDSQKEQQVTVSHEAPYTDIDAGVFNGTISGNVVKDTDLSGDYSVSDTPYSSYQVTLTSNGVTYYATTGADGSYSFTNLPLDQTYTLAVTTPTGTVIVTSPSASTTLTAAVPDVTMQNFVYKDAPVPTSTPTPEPTATSTPTSTPTPEPTATSTPTSTPTPEPTATSTFTPTSTPTATPTTPPTVIGNSISGQVFVDADKDGIVDSSEHYRAGVRISLIDSLGNEVLATTTDENGAYSFTNIVPDTYTVKVTLPTGAALTVVNAGSDDTLDSEFSAVTCMSPVITVTNGSVISEIDAGIIYNAAITITKTADVDVTMEGQTVKYTYVVTNTGTDNLKNVTISDPQLGISGYVIGDLASGQSLTITSQTQPLLAYVVPVGVSAPIDGVVTVSGTSSSEVPVVVTSTSNDPVGLQRISVVVTADKETVKPGDTVVFTYQVTNTGNVDQKDVRISDPTTGISNYVVGDIPAGQSVSVTSTKVLGTAFVVAAGTSSQVTSSVSVSSATGVLGVSIPKNASVSISSTAGVTKTGETTTYLPSIGIILCLGAFGILIIESKRRKVKD